LPAEGKEEAEQRMVGIARAYGSLHAFLRDDEKKIKDLARRYAQAVMRVNEHHTKLHALRTERDGTRGAVPDRRLRASHHHTPGTTHRVRCAHPA
jgi:hypothetical protein